VTVNAVQHYVKGLVDGLQSPYYAPVSAIISNAINLPTEFVNVDVGGASLPQPFAFIWAHTTRKERQTAPRPLAWATRRYVLEIFLTVVDDPNTPNRESAFPCLMDALDIALSTTPLVTTIIDPDTAWESQITSIGEREETELFLPETIGDEVASFLRYGYRCSHYVQEQQNYQPQPHP
jgi:hypothetical protein